MSTETITEPGLSDRPACFPDGMTLEPVHTPAEIEDEPEFDHTGTYSPEDNKLRLYPAYRLDRETYDRVKEAGFSWAPKQEIFVAPMWTPARADLLAELCGEIGDEDTSLVERAEERADRFEDYSDKRASDAHRAREAVAAISDGIPMGQPILVGHHSERHARKDAERIENGMRKAVQMWETSTYWTRRAAGAVAAAKYKELPAVRARRIKTIEADQRKAQREIDEAQLFHKLWSNPANLTLERALTIADRDHLSACFTLDKYPRTNPDASKYEGMMSYWSALKDGIVTPEQAAEVFLANHVRVIKWRMRWLDHYGNRLAYERAMLDEQGASHLLDKKPRNAGKAVLPLLNYRHPSGSVSVRNLYHRGEVIVNPQCEMTSAEYAKISNDYKATRISEDGTHRVRTAMRAGCKVYAVFITDSKAHPIPVPAAPAPVTLPELEPVRASRPYVAPVRTEFDDMKDSLRAGVKVVSAPQLFPTPPALAARMAEMAQIKPGDAVLEPSAGTGRLLDAMPNVRPNGHVVAVEISAALINGLTGKADAIVCGDFLSCTVDALWHPEGFDVILMNPPFANGADIKHIEHARQFLKPGGRLVALCANGPRQQASLKPIAHRWEVLPDGSFASEHTGVNVALLTFVGD